MELVGTKKRGAVNPSDELRPLGPGALLVIKQGSFVAR
jgi:hypothetical protein